MQIELSKLEADASIRAFDGSIKRGLAGGLNEAAILVGLAVRIEALAYPKPALVPVPKDEPAA